MKNFEKYTLELQQISNDICNIKDPVTLELIGKRLVEIAVAMENNKEEDFDSIIKECIDIIKR